MKTVEEIGAAALKEHIIKNWMTHDAMWFVQVLQSHGIEEANRLNKGAIKALAAIELKRAQELFGIEKAPIETFDELKNLINMAFSVGKGDFMRFSYHFPQMNVMRWEFSEKDCFAYKGMKRLGVIDRYECGVLYRVLCWLESAGVKYSVTEEIKGCLMHAKGACAGEVKFFFPQL